MDVADRGTTRNDRFCAECGEIYDPETADNKGLCDSCHIAEQNDAFRKAVLQSPQNNGRFIYTEGVLALPMAIQKSIFNKVMKYDTFGDGNDPYGEHDFGVVEDGNVKVYWKIDYYDSKEMLYGAETPLNCYRLMTIMLAEEY